MQRVCSKCGKILQIECDYCGSLNVRRSRTQPDKFNCGGCLRRGIDPGKKISDTCSECEIKEKRAAQNGGVT